jgi:hypothetical protein
MASGMQRDDTGHYQGGLAFSGSSANGGYVNRPKQGNRFPRRGHGQNWIFIFWGNPHPDSGAMLLEMTFVQAP